MRVGIIDLGTNSLRFDVHEIRHGHTERLHREKFMVKLGQDVFVSGKLSEEATRRTLQALIRFRNAMRILHVDKVVAFATSAIRESEDRDRFIKLVQKRAGIKIQVISGEEEARLIALGILSNEKLPKGAFALVDIGGGSTEVSFCRGKKVQWSFSFQLGVARLQQLFLKRSPPSLSALQVLRGHVQKELQKILFLKKQFIVKTLICSSGTALTLSRVLKIGKSKKTIDTKRFRKWLPKLARMNQTEILALPGMEPKRAELILAGAVVLDEILQALSAKKFQSTEFSLRDGILVQEKQLYRKQSQSNLEFYLPEIAKKAILLGAPANTVRKSLLLCDQVFKRLRKLHKLSTDYLGYLMVAALMKDSGKAIAFKNHAGHSYYIAKNLDIPFLLPWESALIAELCLLHEASNLPHRPQKRKAFLKLLAMLQVVDALTHGFSSKNPLRQIRLRKKEIGFYLDPAVVTDIEILRLERRARFLKKVFKRSVLVKILNG